MLYLDVLLVYVLLFVVLAADDLLGYGKVVHVPVEGGLVEDELAVYELVGHLLAGTVYEKIVCRWVGCGQVAGMGAVCVLVD